MKTKLIKENEGLCNAGDLLVTLEPFDVTCMLGSVFNYNPKEIRIPDGAKKVVIHFGEGTEEEIRRIYGGK